MTPPPAARRSATFAFSSSLIATLWLSPAGAFALPVYEEHVIFDNSPVNGPYYHSEAEVVAPSTLESEAGKILVTTERFRSPPNGLRLKWSSATGGDWRMKIRDPGRDWRDFALKGDTLAFWCWSDTEITEANSPRVYMQNLLNIGSPSLTFVTGQSRLPAQTWVQVRLPFGVFDPATRGTSETELELKDAVSLTFTQGLDDGKEHTVYVDDFMIIDSTATDSTPPAAPTAPVARGYERHVDVSWQPSPSEDVFAYRIYRSLDGGDSLPVGTRRNTWTRFMDFVGPQGQSASYRISALDLAGNESPLSPPSAAASTRAMGDDELLDMVQEGCFRYYWEAGHPVAGMSPEILPGNENLIALGGNGFGIMALLVATERGFVTRAQGVERMLRIVRFLAAADRFHGAWPHFLDGGTGRTIPFFGIYDDGADLVETAFAIQGLLAARVYFDRNDADEREIRDTATRLWREVEWDWFRQPTSNDILTWHWSPNHGFHINHPLIGWNETLIIYLLAIASPTHPVPASLWHTGWAGQSERHVKYRQGWGRTTAGDHFVNGNSYFGIPLDVGVGSGAELFFAHFSFMGFDPRGRRDRYTNYFNNNRALSLINRAYCIDNPRGFSGYGADCWGRSAGVNSGGGKPIPREDNGTINTMAALSSMPYTPQESMAALRHFYRELGPRIWGTYGFHDSFNASWNWYDEDYMALNQAPIVVMIENHRTGLVWNKFMANPEIAPALEAIGFRPDAAPQE